ncbi:tetratricopeptide repeat domain-containing protein [Apiospora marii]|uniref:Tetratricopeptide repeat domain-containing protein n=1 Tax=Apiospora marii TaxID=335849 RepID=A0ABR1R582_9PEZI
MQLRNPGTVQLLSHVQPAAGTRVGVDIVIIPGVWADETIRGPSAHYAWVQSLAQSLNTDARILLFSYQIAVDGTSLWDQLLTQGHAFLDGLDKFRVPGESSQRPLLLISHSLGGFIAKRALAMRIGSRKAFEDVISGLIFLGCPHLISNSPESWNHVQLIMKANRKDINKQNMIDIEMERLITTCRQFEDLQLTVPILSVYEARATRFRYTMIHALRQGSKYTDALITGSMVEIKSPRESKFKAEKKHFELCVVDRNDPLYQRLSQYFTIFGHHAPSNVRTAFRDIPVHTSLLNGGLRARSSISSFQDDSDFTPRTSQYTPEGSSPATWFQLGPTFLEHDSGYCLPEQERKWSEIHFPISYIASISRREEFYGRKGIMSQIDHEFGIKPHPKNDCLDPQNTRPKSYVLCGMAGIGKTEIAVEYLYSRQDHFDATFWVYADTVQKLGAQFVMLARELGQGSSSESIDEISARELVKGWLASPRGYRPVDGELRPVEGRWLFVFDNADAPDVLYDWLPTEGPGCILVTSKYPFLTEHSYRLGVGQHVEPFPLETGSRMLRELSGRGHAENAVEHSLRIANMLGGLPLAISQMSAIIQQKQLSFQDFEEWYEEDSKGLHNLGFHGMPANYQHTVGTAYTVEQLASPSKSLLNILSVLDPDRIPEEMFLEGLRNDILSGLLSKRHEYFNARAELIHASLVTRNMATNELRVHRIVQDVVRGQLSEDDLRSVYAAVSRLISAVWPFVCGTDPTRNQAWRIPVAERYTPHICMLERIFGPGIREGRFTGTTTSGFVFSSYAWYIFERGQTEQTERFANLARQILEKPADASLEDEERVTHWLGEAHHSLSLAAVLSCSSDGLEDANTWLAILRRRITKFDMPSDRLCLATAYNNLGICYSRVNAVEEAIASWRQSLAEFDSAIDAPPFSGTFPRISLSLLLVSQDQVAEAEKVLVPALEEHERLLGKDDKTTTESGHIWRSMGNIRNAQGRHEEAMEYHQSAVDNLRVTLGEMHYFTGDSFYSLAVDHWKQGATEKAMANLDHAIQAFAMDKNGKPQEARAKWMKGCLLKANGNPTSDVLLQEAMSLRRELSPNDTRPVEDLKGEDWSELVFYWSK